MALQNSDTIFSYNAVSQPLRRRTVTRFNDAGQNTNTTPPYKVWKNWGVETFVCYNPSAPYIDWYCNGAGNPYPVVEIHTTNVHYQKSTVPDFPSDIVDSAYNKALGKLVTRLTEARSQWNAAVALGESGEMLSMFVQTAKRITGAVRSVRKGDVKGALKSLGALKGGRNIPKARSGANGAAQNWLEIQYGWLPLLSDLDSAARYFAEKAVNNGFRPKKFHGSGKQTVSTEVRIFENAYSSKPPYTYLAISGVKRLTASEKITVSCYPQASEHLILDELGFTDPATVLWELAPFSFVVDWFVNVGDVLSSIHELSHWVTVAGVRSSRHEQYFHHARIGQSVGYSLCSVNPLQERRSFDITPFAGFCRNTKSVRQIGWTLPTAVPLQLNLEDPFKGKRAANAIALLSQTLKIR